MRGFKTLDDEDTDYERHIAFLEVIDTFEEESIVPKIFRQFEKEYNQKPNREYLRQRFGLSNYMTTKLFRICQKRKKLGLNRI